MPFPELVTTARLRLHRWDAAIHTPGLAAVNAQSPAVTYLNGGVPYTYEESARQSARFATHWSEHAFGLWALELRATGEIIGFTGVAHPLWFPAYAHEVEAGWRLHPSHWRHGYATEAARAAVDAAFTQLPLERLISLIDPENTPSIAVATRLGMTLATTVDHPQHPGKLHIFELPRPT